MKLLKSRKPLIESVMSLSLLNILNMAIPLITLPYLVKVVGLSYFGKYSIVLSMIQYIILFTSYGFNFSTTRQVSVHRNNQDKIQTIFISTITCKLLLSVLPILFFAFLSQIIFSTDHTMMLLWGLGMVIGDILNPVWLFQGMEKMRYMTIVNFVSKLCFTGLIFIFIREKEDYIYITLYNSAGYLVAGLLSLYIAFHDFKLKLIIPRWKEICFQLKDGFYIFLSTIFMNLYRNSNTFILGLFVNDGLVGMYAGAEKIVKAIQSVAEPVSTAFFPHLAESFAHNTVRDNIKRICKLSKILLLFLVVLALTSFISAPLLNSILLDAQEKESILLIRVMTPVILFGGINYVLGIVGLVNLGKNRSFLNIVIVSGLFSILFLLMTVKIWGNISAAIAMVFAELLITIGCTFYLKKMYDINYSS